MTQEEKQLLLVDLCARLLYGVYIFCKWKEPADNGTVGFVTKMTSFELDQICNMDECDDIPFSEVKLYLRPLSSMTEEEVKEFYDVERMGHPVGYIKPQCDWHFTIKGIDWLNARHFDYRGLIEKGLALEAPEGIYNTK